jgi:hypothetical protein
MEIVRVLEDEVEMIRYEIDRVESYYKVVAIVGAILFGLGLVI